MNLEEGPDNTTNVVTTFDDPGGTLHGSIVPLVGSSTIPRSVPDTSLESFLARPTLVTTLTWTTGAFNGYFNPYTLGSSPSLKEKIKNYSHISFQAHMKVEISGSPFYYGAVTMAFLPNGSRVERAGTGGARLMRFPHIIIEPNNDRSYEMALPFFHHVPVLNISGQNATAYDDLGNVAYSTLWTLDSVSSTVVAPTATIAIFVWYTDVKLYGPNPIAYSPTGDEVQPSLSTPPSVDRRPAKVATATEAVKQGPIATIATAVRNVATAAKSLPFIGPYAVATEVAAGAAASVAAFFGWSRPHYMESRSEIIKRPLGDLNTLEGKDHAVKFSYDPLQGLGVSPTILGFGAVDEMDYDYIKGRYGYYGYFAWDNTATTNAVLHKQVVAPIAGMAVTGNQRLLPPVTHLTLAHGFWRGGLTYKFHFTSNSLMRGKLLVRYVPFVDAVGNWNNPPGYGEPTSYQCVMDLQKSNVFEFTIGHQQAELWLNTDKLLMASSPFNTALNGTGTINYNGYFVVHVLSPLKSQGQATNIACLMSIRGADTFQVADPSTRFINSQFQYAGDELAYEAEPSEICELAPDLPCPTSPYVVNFGEQVASVRSLLKRYVQSDIIGATALLTTVDADPKSTGGFVSLKLPLKQRGQNIPQPSDSLLTNSIDEANSSFYAWFAPAYVAERGGQRYKVVATGATFNNGGTMLPDTSLGQKMVATQFQYGSDNQSAYQYIYDTSTNVYSSSYVGSTTKLNGHGNAWFDVEASGEFEFSDYNPMLYRYANPPASTADDAECGAQDGGMVVIRYVPVVGATTTAYPTLSVYSAAADDFSFFGYIGPPQVDLGF